MKPGKSRVPMNVSPGNRNSIWTFRSAECMTKLPTMTQQIKNAAEILNVDFHFVSGTDVTGHEAGANVTNGSNDDDAAAGL